MGGKSSSSSSSSNTTTNTQTIQTESRAIEDTEGVAVVGGSGSTEVNLSDQGAIEAGKDVAIASLDASEDIADSAFGFGGEAIQRNAEVTESALDFAGDFGDEAFAFGGDALDFAESQSRHSQQTADRALNSLSGAITRAGNVSRSDSSQSLENIALYAAAAIAVVFIAMSLRRR